MKRYPAYILVFAVFLMLSGCGSSPDTADSGSLSYGPENGSPTPAPNPEESSRQNTPEEGVSDTNSLPDPEESYVWRLRIAEGTGTDTLVLAGEKAGELFTLTPGKETPVYLDGKEADLNSLEDGMLIDVVYDGTVMETYPGQLGQVYAIRAYSPGTKENPHGGYYDLCGFYLQVLNDLWDKDPGLNGDIEYISLDLSQAPGGLWEGEKAAIAWLFGCQHQTVTLSFSREELAENGYLTELNLDSQYKLYQWDNGILFTVTPCSRDGEENHAFPVLHFNAEKWRSPTGAYIFWDCQAVWPETGTWTDYEIGSEMIS